MDDRLRRRGEAAVRWAVENPDEFERQQAAFMDVDAQLERFRGLNAQLTEALDRDRWLDDDD
jgi:hypothetical protein